MFTKTKKAEIIVVSDGIGGMIVEITDTVLVA
jgi:hypothetical protein